MLKNLLNILKLVRWPNLLIMAFILLVLRYGFIIPLEFDVYLTPLWHSVFILATLLIAAGGNAINDAFDVHTDRINKPDRMVIGKGVTRETAKFIGQVFLLLGTILGLLMGYLNDLLTFSYVFPFTALLLWFYAADLKRRTIIGNLTIAFLGGLMVFNEAIFDLLQTLNSIDRDIQIQSIWVVIAISAFSFLLTLAREIIKDLQDIEGDRKAGYKTLPITAGTLFPKILSILILMLVTVSVGWLLYNTIQASDWISAGYLFVFIIAPLLLIIVRIAPANNPDAFSKISNLIKIIMVTGVFSVLIFTLSFKMTF